MPTINYKCGVIKTLPNLCVNDENVAEHAKINIALSRDDWDSFETSWDFTTHPLVYLSKGLWERTNVACMMEHYYGELPKVSCPLEICYLLWQGQCNERFNKLPTRKS